MRVKIITLHCPINYGAALQAYALKAHLQKEGYDAELIDYRPSYVTDKQAYTYAGSLAKSKNYLKKALYLIAKFPSRFRVKRNFGRFLKNELCSTGVIYHSYEELKSNPPVADVYICGSDQIWNTNMENGWDDSFFLSFVKHGKKYSYAASMAINRELSVEESNRFKTQLADYEAISVREQDAQQILQPIIKKNINWVLDPVYLLSAEQWMTLANKEKPVAKGKYILLYPMGNGENVNAVAQALSQKSGLPIYAISRSMKIKSDRVFNGYSPYQFLQLMRGAEYVVTNSFHGTSFSIIFQKNFWACSIGKTSSRIASLLGSLDLKHRYIDTPDIPYDRLVDTIDYVRPMDCLQTRLQESKSFIDYILKDK